MRRFYFILSAVLLSFCTLSATAAEKEQKADPKNNFKFYGFIRNYFAFDSRESVSGTGDLFYYLPKDVSMKDGIDVNDQASFRFLALTSRLGVDVSGYSIGNVHFGAKVEGDFYAGLSNSSNANASVYFPGNTKYDAQSNTTKFAVNGKNTSSFDVVAGIRIYDISCLFGYSHNYTS